MKTPEQWAEELVTSPAFVEAVREQDTFAMERLIAAAVRDAVAAVTAPAAQGERP